jgi:hypothetical protein
MPDRTPPSPDHRLPRPTRAGIVVIGLGLLFDLGEHGFGPPADAPTVGRFPLTEHAAHLVIVVGMVAVIVGIVIDGIRISRGRERPTERSRSHALR